MNLIDTIIYNGESKYIELKTEFNSSALKTISAFANYHDGSIFIGITDDGSIVDIDTDIDTMKLSIENSINDNIVPRPFYELIKHNYNDHCVLETKVYHGNFTPYTYRKRVHRDYMKTGDIKIEFFDDRIEIISPGSLPLGLSEEEFLTGRISVPRNKIICDVFFRLKIIEKMATGIRRIKEYYSTYKEKPSFLVRQNSITVILPKATKTNEPINTRLTLSEVAITNFIKDNGEIARQAAEKLINKGKTQTTLVLKKRVEKGLLIVLNKGKNTKYTLRK